MLKSDQKNCTYVHVYGDENLTSRKPKGVKRKSKTQAKRESNDTHTRKILPEPMADDLMWEFRVEICSSLVVVQVSDCNKGSRNMLL